MTETSFRNDNRPLHVIPAEGGGWAVKRSGCQRASRRFGERGAAIEWAEHRADEVVIHRLTGSIETVRRYRQIRNPKGWWVKVETERGQIIGHRRTPWPGVVRVAYSATRNEEAC